MHDDAWSTAANAGSTAIEMFPAKRTETHGGLGQAVRRIRTCGRWAGGAWNAPDAAKGGGVIEAGCPCMAALAGNAAGGGRMAYGCWTGGCPGRPSMAPF